MPKPAIHPSAIVSDDAQLGESVSVGPLAIIEAGAILGDRCTVGPHAQILAPSRIGPDNRIGAGAIIGGDPQDLSFDPLTDSTVVMGEGNTIREYVTIHRSSRPGGATTLGNGNFLMAVSHVGHDTHVGDDCVIANNAMLAGHVTIGNRVFVGGGSAIHQFIRLGDLCITQGNSAMSRDVPPFCVAAQLNRLVGLNVIGLRRAGFDDPTRADIKRAYDLVYRSNRNLSQALESAASLSWTSPAAAFLEFLGKKAKKGVCFPK